MAPEIERITNTFLKSPAKIEVARQATASETITQSLIQFAPTRKDKSFAEKRAVLRALITAEGAACTNAIIFCNRKMDVDVVSKSLKGHGFNAEPIHGDLDQSQRTRTLESFRDGGLHLLVASDVAARGLDIPAVSHVFNFDVPSHPEDYVHRIGRTGRAGREGKAYTIAVTADDKLIRAIEMLVKQEIPRGTLPEGLDLAAVVDDRGPSDRPKREGGREGGREAGRGRGREDRKPREVVEKVAVAAEPAAEPPREEKREAPREERRPRREDRPESRPEVREPRRSEEPRPERREYHRREDHGPAVVGLGDHVPDFILRSFKLTAPATADDEVAATGTEG